MGISILLAGNLSSSPGRPPGLSADPENMPGLDFSALLTSQLMVAPEIGKLPTLQADKPERSDIPVDIDATIGAQLSSPGRPPELSTAPDNLPGLDFSALLNSQLMPSPEVGKLPTLPADTPERNGLAGDIDATTGAQLPQTVLTQDRAQGPEKLLAFPPPPAPSSARPEATQEATTLVTTSTELLRVNVATAGRQENTSPDEAGPALPSLAQKRAPTTTVALEHHQLAEATPLSTLQEPPRTPAQQQVERLAVAVPTLQAAMNAPAVPQEAPKKTLLPQAAQAELTLADKKSDLPLASASRIPATGTFAETLAGRVFVAADGNGAPAIVAAESSNGQTSPINSVGIPGEKVPAAGSPMKDGPVAIHAPLHDPRWNQQLGDRVLWMARGEAQTAQINITPAQLGPIQISISLQGDQMTAQFISAHQEVRQALEDAMPRLREMLANAGINLGQANVGTQQQQRDTRAQFAAAVPSAGEEAILPGDASWNTLPAQPLQRGRGMIDLFA